MFSSLNALVDLEKTTATNKRTHSKNVTLLNKCSVATIRNGGSHAVKISASRHRGVHERTTE